MTKRRLRKLITSLFVLLLMALVYYTQPKQTENTGPQVLGTYRVIAYADGDTITVDMNGTPERIRMVGVDTPETKKPDAPAQCYANEAAKFTSDKLTNASVRLEADTKSDNRDRYSRLLRYVFLQDNTMLNKKLIEDGYGFAYTQFPFDKKAEFIAAQESARLQKKGLWGICSITDNNGRLRTNAVN
jgi:micrococcal nuclease